MREHGGGGGPPLKRRVWSCVSFCGVELRSRSPPPSSPAPLPLFSAPLPSSALQLSHIPIPRPQLHIPLIDAASCLASETLPPSLLAQQVDSNTTPSYPTHHPPHAHSRVTPARRPLVRPHRTPHPHLARIPCNGTTYYSNRPPPSRRLYPASSWDPTRDLSLSCRYSRWISHCTQQRRRTVRRRPRPAPPTLRCMLQCMLRCMLQWILQCNQRMAIPSPLRIRSSCGIPPHPAHPLGIPSNLGGLQWATRSTRAWSGLHRARCSQCRRSSTFPMHTR